MTLFQSLTLTLDDGSVFSFPIPHRFTAGTLNVVEVSTGEPCTLKEATDQALSPALRFKEGTIHYNAPKTHKPKILVFNDDPGIGGVARHTHTLIMDLAKDFEILHVLDLETMQSLNPKSIQEQTQAGVHFGNLMFNPVHHFGVSVANEGLYQRFIDAFNPDLVIFEDSCPVSHLAAKRVVQRRGIPYIPIAQLVATYFLQTFADYMDEVERAYQYAHEVVGVSQYSLNLLHQYFGLNRNKGIVIHNAVDPKFLEPRNEETRRRLRSSLGIPEDAVLVTTSARFEEVKGYDQVGQLALSVKADPELRDKVHFLWMGAGSLEQYLKDDYGSREDLNIHILPFQDNVEDWLDASDLFVLLSKEEGLPIALIEALSKELPCISTRVSGIPEINCKGLHLPKEHDQFYKLKKLVEVITKHREVGWDRESEDYLSFCLPRGFEPDHMMKKYREVINKLMPESWQIEQGHKKIFVKQEPVNPLSAGIPLVQADGTKVIYDGETFVTVTEPDPITLPTSPYPIPSQPELRAYGEQLIRYLEANPTCDIGKVDFLPLYFLETDDLVDLAYKLRAEILGRHLKAEGHDPFLLNRQPRIHSKIRVGILVTSLFSETETRAVIPWLHLDPKRFDTFVFRLHSDPNHPLEQQARKVTRSVIPLNPNSDVKALVTTIRAYEPDVMFIGTNITSQINLITVLAAHRLAPIQIHGHNSPVLSHLPSMTHYLTSTKVSEGLDDSDRDYEKYLRLDGPAQCFYYEDLKETPEAIKTKRYSIACGANYFKITREMVDSWVNKLKIRPSAILNLYPFNPNWTDSYPVQEFCEKLKDIVNDPEVCNRITIHKGFKDQNEVREFLATQCEYIDSFPYSGVTSLIDALGVCDNETYWGETMRSKMGAILAEDPENSYLDIPTYAKKLGDLLEAELEKY